MLLTFRQKITHVLRHAFPAPCLLCHARSTNSALCDDCTADLPRLAACCPLCATPLSIATVCGACLAKPPEQDSSLSLYHYRQPIDSLIVALKHHDQRTLTDLFADEFAKQLTQNEMPLPDCLVAIPLHPERLQQRGYNQALEFARALSIRLNIPVRLDLLDRIKNTPIQAGLSLKQRQKNMRNAFKSPFKPNAVRKIKAPQHIALIDDVMTTGLTFNIAAKALRDIGVHQIDAWSIARTSSRK